MLPEFSDELVGECLGDSTKDLLSALSITLASDITADLKFGIDAGWVRDGVLWTKVTIICCFGEENADVHKEVRDAA